MAPLTRIRLQAGTLPTVIGSLIRETRHAIGWSQDELAWRAATSQTKVWRIERGDPAALDLATLDRVLGALGLRPTLEIEGRHLADRVDQRDPVHAALAASVAGRLSRCGWDVASEVPTGAASPTGWIDLLGYRERDASLAIVEIKTDLPDIGGLQRQVSWYEREAPYAARRLGWRPEHAAIVVVCLDTTAIAQQLRDHRPILGPAFPGDARALSAWLRDPAAPPPAHRTLVVTDLARHRGLALEPSGLHGRRPAAEYRDYADAAAVLASRRLGGRARRRD
jgi:transcriptional regulator with XRE-family HTH domain